MRRYLGRTMLIRPAEALVIGALAVMLAALLNALDGFDRLVGFVQAHPELGLDQLFFAIVFSGMAALYLAVRRARDLAREMRKRTAAQERARKLARHDPLTGLANRRVLHEELPALLEQSLADRRETAVLMIDLDQFKPINDLYGRDAGDAVLIDVAARLQRVCGANCLIARTGGDEFAVVFSQANGVEAVARLAANIIRALELPFAVKGQRFGLGATVGIARCPADADTPDALLRAADIAIHAGKRAGKGKYRFFQAEMDERLRAQAALENELRGALERGEVVPYFQPIKSLDDGRTLGFEALARWHHPERGVIGPDIFVPIAEENGLTDALSSQVLRAACLAARGWDPATTLSINIAPVQLRDQWLAARLLAILSETGFAPGRLIVEIPESAIVEDVALAAEVFESLHAAGIRIALDDFGAGYSGLARLRFDHLKIDGSFIQSMDSIETQKIVGAIAGLGVALGLPVIAEGVETLEAAETLRRLGCEQVQGYLFGAPEPFVPGLSTEEFSEPLPRRLAG